MSFVHTGMMIAAAGLAGVPLLIHLLSRRAYRTEPWAAMQFLVSAQTVTRRRLRIEQWLLLALRILTVLLVGLALSRPFLASSSIIGTLGHAAESKVIVLDDSLSMRARRDDGASAFEAGLGVARRIVDSSDARDAIGLVLASAPARSVIQRCTRDHQAVRSALDALQCSLRMNDLNGAVEAGAASLDAGDDPSGTRSCYVITDMTAGAFAQGGWAETASSASIAKVGESVDRLIILDVGPKSRRNLAIKGLNRVSQVIGSKRPATYSLELANESDEVISSLTVSIGLDGVTTRKLRLEQIGPWQTVVEEFELTLNVPGPHRIVARIENADDGLPEDDVCFLAVDVVNEMRVLCVQDLPTSNAEAEPLFYVRAALGGRESADDRDRLWIRTCSAHGLASEVLSNYAVVILGDLPRISVETGRRLQQYVAAGGGLIIALADRASPEGYSVHRAGDAGWLPVYPGAVVRAANPAQALGYKLADPHNSALRDFNDNPVGGLQRAIVTAYRDAQSADKPGLQTLLVFSDGSPALVQQRVGRGLVLCWLTSIDMSWTNLPGKPDFVPLMLNLAHLAASGASREVNTMIGTDVAWIFPMESAGDRLPVVTPGGHTYQSGLLAVEGAAVMTVEKAGESGFYTAGAGVLRRLAAVNCDTSDSDLSRASIEQVRRALGVKVEVVAEEGIASAIHRAAPPREFAQIMMICLLAVVVVETIVGTVLGGVR